MDEMEANVENVEIHITLSDLGKMKLEGNMGKASSLGHTHLDRFVKYFYNKLHKFSELIMNPITCWFEQNEKSNISSIFGQIM